ncbi:MAG: hypothetical protein ABL890_00675 [Candidatus Peribacteraceae bacterium]
MPVFRYTALNPEGKSVRGTVEASDADTARVALEDMKYVVESIFEPSRTENKVQSPAPVQMSGTAFVFEGTNREGVLMKGTVHAASRRAAFDQLRTERQLTISRLAPLGSPPTSFDAELERWNTESVAPVKKAVEKPTPSRQYHPVLSTIRLYAAWLLAWYGLFIALGYYVSERALPWDIPFVSAFASSSLVFTFVTAIFSFLLLSTLHRSLKGSTLTGAVFGILWLLIVLAARSVQI